MNVLIPSSCGRQAMTRLFQPDVTNYGLIGVCVRVCVYNGDGVTNMEALCEGV